MEQDGDQAATLHAMRSIQRSETAFDLRRYEQSLREAQAATVAMPSYWFSFVLQAQALLALERQGRLQEAASLYKSAVLADPTLAFARKNTHGAVSKWTLPVVGGGLAVATKAAVGSKVIAAVVATNIARLSTPSGLATATGVLVVVAVIVAGGVLFERRRRMRALKSDDPQLHAMFEKLDAAAKTGKL